MKIASGRHEVLEQMSVVLNMAENRMESGECRDNKENYLNNVVLTNKSYTFATS